MSRKLMTPEDQKGNGLPVYTLGAAQNVSYNAAGGASTQSTAFADTTVALLLTTTSDDVRIAIGANPVATATSTLIPKPAMVIFAAPPGGKLAVLSNGVGTGNVSVTELASFNAP